MPIDPKHIRQIAKAMTDDPDIFNENLAALGKAGLEAGKKCAQNPTCRQAAAAAGKWAVDKGKEFLKKKAESEVETEGEDCDSMSESYTNKCRNKVYRQGTVLNCGRMCCNLYCEDCTKARSALHEKILGLTEAKKEPSNKPDELDVEDDFEVHDGYDEDKKEPGKPGKQKRKSSLQDGPEGEKGSKKSPYLKEEKEPKKCGRCDLGLEWSKAEEHGLCDECSKEL